MISWCVEEEVVTSVVSSALLYLWTELLRNTNSSGFILSPAHVVRQLLPPGRPARRRRRALESSWWLQGG